MRTRQEIFNLAWNGLKAQGFKQSLDSENTCVYRGPGGMRCALGHAIPDRKYRKRFEGSVPCGVGGEDICAAIGIDGNEVEFATILQQCHDEAWNPNDMENKLRDFAEEYSLKIPVEAV